MKRLLVCTAILCLALGATAQQMEPNDPGGSLTSNGANPTPGVPFAVNVTGNMVMEVGGLANAGYALVLGDLAASSFPIGDGQFFDLNTGNAFLVGNGLGGGGGALPPNFFILNGAGQSNLLFAANASMNGLFFGFQAIVFDPAALFQINFTAAAEFAVSSVQCIQSDDVVQNFPIPSGNTVFYGQPFSNIDFSTNGWVRFGGGATSSDLGENADNFVNGTIGGGPAAPCLAILWEDLDFGNGLPGQMICANEVIPGMITIDMLQGDYFSATFFGDVLTTIDTTGGTPVVTIDYTGYAAGAPPTEGLVGVSDGMTAASVAQSHNLATGGVVNPFSPVNAAETVFQNFDGQGTLVPPQAAEAFDLGGIVLNIVDASGLGAMTIF